MDRIGKQRRKKEFFTDRVEPNILLTGWRTWWTRMDAESRTEISSRRLDSDSARSRTYANNVTKKSFVSKYFTTTGPRNINTQSESKMKMVVSADGNISNTHGKNIQISTNPKRKLSINILEGSPAKIQKIRENFNKNLQLFRTLEHTSSEGTPVALTHRNNFESRIGTLSARKTLSGGTIQDYLTGQQTLPNLEVKGNPELN